MLMLALRIGMPNFFRFFASVMPVFLGFALSGTLFFGHISHYVSMLYIH